ncbi:DUF1801 domain-containing protein [bacterium]|nr:DUF1801 domain-containing protein [bacterium]NUN44409.1 DUF1801 domain-containing protein [bacterium]
MAENKTKATKLSVQDFLKTIKDEQTIEDCNALIKLMKKITGKPAVMWGPSIIGFDSYHYKYESGREGDMCITGFSPRKGKISIYITSGFERYTAHLKKIGKCKTSKACLYVKSLSDIDTQVLEEMIKDSIIFMKKKWE